jgi:Domain of unknown function (DUF932)
MLMLHCNAFSAGRDRVFAIPTPEPTTTWKPVAHRQFIESILEQSDRSGLTLKSEGYGLTRHGHRLFGVLAFEQSAEHGFCIGIRNSHDKTMTAGIVAGARIFVCDNLAFSGAFQVKRKHTSGIDISAIVCDAFKQLPDQIENLFKNLERLKVEGLSDDEARAVIFRTAEKGVIAPSEMLGVWNEYKQPCHEEFREPTKFNLLMAFTEKAKRQPVSKLDRLHQQLPALLGY